MVTWDEDDPTRDNGYDIWAQRFSKGLQPLGDSPANSAPFVVNSTLTGNQRYPAVAMDTEGDFVITWQSNGNTTAGSNQGNTGYGVYYQRFTPGGAPIGGVNDVQTLTFSGNFGASDNFTLNWNGQTTASISYDGSPLDAASAIQNALDNIGANVQVQALSSTEVTIEFVGLEGSQFEPQIQVGTTNFSEGGSVVAATLVSGVSGESPVSQSAAGNETNPSIAMAPAGNFVISWTATGQGGDAPNQTSIYAQAFASNTTLYGAVLSEVDPQAATPPGVEPLIMTNDDPGKHVLSPGTSSDGVVEIDNNNPGAPALGSGTLLTGGNFILTAAHVVCLTETSIIPAPAGDLSVTFRMPTGDVVIPAKQVWVDPGWDANPVDGNDWRSSSWPIRLPQAPWGTPSTRAATNSSRRFPFTATGNRAPATRARRSPRAPNAGARTVGRPLPISALSKRPAALPGAPTFSSTISRVPTPISSAP